MDLKLDKEYNIDQGKDRGIEKWALPLLGNIMSARNDWFGSQRPQIHLL